MVVVDQSREGIIEESPKGVQSQLAISLIVVIVAPHIIATIIAVGSVITISWVELLNLNLSTYV